MAAITMPDGKVKRLYGKTQKEARKKLITVRAAAQGLPTAHPGRFQPLAHRPARRAERLGDAAARPALLMELWHETSKFR